MKMKKSLFLFPAIIRTTTGEWSRNETLRAYSRACIAAGSHNPAMHLYLLLCSRFWWT